MDKRILETLKGLSPQELKTLLVSLIQEDKDKALPIAEAIGKVLESEIRNEKLKTDIAVAQSRIYVLTRDVEEVAILPEAVKRVLGEGFYEGDLSQMEGLRALALRHGIEREGGVELLYDSLKRVLTPFKPSEALAWTLKMLKNQSISLVEGEYPIAVSKPLVYVDDKKKLRSETYYLGIVAKGKRKTSFYPFFTVTLVNGKDETRIYLSGEDITDLSVEKLLQLQPEPPNLSFPAEKETVEALTKELTRKFIDKWVFFAKTVSSSKLNQALRTLLSQKGFFTPRKNQSVFIPAREETEQVVFLLIKSFRAVVEAIQLSYAETKKLIKENPTYSELPSLKKQLHLAREILIEEVALLSKERIIEQLKEMFENSLYRLKKEVEKGTPYEELKNREWFREMQNIAERINLNPELVREFERLKTLLKQNSVSLAVTKLLNSQPNVARFDKLLSTLRNSPNPESYRERVKEVFGRLVETKEKG
jgi:ribosomal protein S21